MGLYASQKMFSLHEMIDLTMKGIAGLMPLALLMLMAFAIVNVCKDLETGSVCRRDHQVMADTVPGTASRIPDELFHCIFDRYVVGHFWHHDRDRGADGPGTGSQ